MKHYLDGGPGYRSTDTSIAGALYIAGVTAEQQRAVITVVGEREAQGAIGDEIADQLGWPPFRVRPRTSELRVLGRIVDSGQRRPGHSGVRQIVWVLPQFAPEKEEAV